MTNDQQITALGMDRDQVSSLMDSLGEPAYRAKQLLDAVYRQRADSIEEISTFPVALRGKLVERGVSVGLPRIEKRFVSVDGTVRYLISFADGQSVETVWMPEGDGGESDGATEAIESLEDGQRDWKRATICVSSQVGCAVDCQFCLTALLGVKRNLSPGEIAGQVLAVLKDQKVLPQHERINLVFMGMGEPFLNYDSFMKAVRLLVQEVGLAESRMTVSTAGIVPRISQFGREEIRPRLAISLNASNDDLRTQVMPINKKWNLEMLMGAAREFPLRNRERVTFEYVLLHDVNDSPGNAREVVELLRGIRARVNLIALNPGPGIGFQTPTDERVAEFQQILRDAGVLTFVRRPRGRDIFAACGQLKRTVEIATAPAR
jgi:23S rRNA (adenine2503-C2)-methyltransferase